MKLRQYSGPLTVVSMGILGFSLFCILAAVALTDPRKLRAAAIEPKDIVDSAFANMNTMAALTVEVISQYVYTATPSLTQVVQASPTSQATATLFIPLTSNQATRTRSPGAPRTATKTPTHIPTNTPHPSLAPTLTYTVSPIPTTTRTRTPTPAPTDTYTPVPPTVTDTPEPPPTPTDTLEPPPSPTDTPIEPTQTPATPAEVPTGIQPFSTYR